VNYTVIRKPAAEAELAEMWLNAANRDVVAAAANEIDRLLGTNPAEQGESRSGATRVTFVYPVGVFFDVQEEDRIVSVLRLWRVD